MRMDGLAVTLTLLACVAVLGVLAGAGWLLVGFALRVSPAPAARFALANMALAAGALTTAQRAIVDAPWMQVLASLLALFALAVGREGIQRLLGLAPTRREHVAFLAACALLILIGRSTPSLTDIARMTVIGGLAWICVRVVVESHPVMRRDFGVLAALLMGAPFAAMVALLLWQLIRWTIDVTSVGATHSLLTSQSQTILWGFVGLMVIANSAMMGMTLGRLVIRTRQLAERDMLTGVLSRRALEKHLSDEHARSRRSGQPLAMAICDLDFFKRVNDAHGHAAGDMVLRTTAATLQRALREPDAVGRFGGEEFIVVMPMTNAAGGADAAERMRAAIAAAPVMWQDVPIDVTASFGVAVVGDDLQRAFRAADEALYRAKAEGRNRVVSAPELRRAAA